MISAIPHRLIGARSDGRATQHPRAQVIHLSSLDERPQVLLLFWRDDKATLAVLFSDAVHARSRAEAQEVPRSCAVREGG